MCCLRIGLRWSGGCVIAAKIPKCFIERRLVTASREIENYNKYDYILINDSSRSRSKPCEAIVRSERLKKLEQPLSPDEKRIVELADRHRLTNVKDRLEPILASFSAPAPSARP